MTGRKKLSRLPGKKDWLASWQVFLQRFGIILSYSVTIDLPEAGSLKLPRKLKVQPLRDISAF